MSNDTPKLPLGIRMLLNAMKIDPENPLPGIKTHLAGLNIDPEKLINSVAQFGQIMASIDARLREMNERLLHVEEHLNGSAGPAAQQIGNGVFERDHGGAGTVPGSDTGTSKPGN